VDGPGDHQVADAGASDHYRHREADGIRVTSPNLMADYPLAHASDGGALPLDGCRIDEWPPPLSCAAMVVRL